MAERKIREIYRNSLIWGSVSIYLYMLKATINHEDKTLLLVNLLNHSIEIDNVKFKRTFYFDDRIVVQITSTHNISFPRTTMIIEEK